jgi:predicted amidohydrolase
VDRSERVGLRGSCQFKDSVSCARRRALPKRVGLCRGYQRADYAEAAALSVKIPLTVNQSLIYHWFSSGAVAHYMLQRGTLLARFDWKGLQKCNHGRSGAHESGTIQYISHGFDCKAWRCDLGVAGSAVSSRVFDPFSWVGKNSAVPKCAALDRFPKHKLCPEVKKMRRRTFLTGASMGMAAFASGVLPKLGAGTPMAKEADGAATSLGVGTTEPIGRPVRIVSIGFLGTNLSLEQIVGYVDQEGSRDTDVIVLPETCRGQNASSEEQMDGPTVTAMAALAAKHHTYIAVPIDRRDGDRRLNTVVLLDRKGRVVSHYDKVFPYWSEYAIEPPVSPGDSSEVYEADFGRLGIATCFDVNFPEVWRRLSELGAEITVWPSAYSAGCSLQAHAISHHYYIVTSSATPDCIAYDIDGERLLYETAKDVNISRVTVDLDRGIYHQNFNLEKRDKLLREHSEDVVQEKWMPLEQWFVLKAKRPGVSARALAKQYGLEELRHYIERSRKAIDKRRGWEFAGKAAFPDKTIGELQGFDLKKNS